MKRIYLMLFLTFAFFGLANAQCPFELSSSWHDALKFAEGEEDFTEDERGNVWVNPEYATSDDAFIRSNHWEGVLSVDPRYYQTLKFRIKNNTSDINSITVYCWMEPKSNLLMKKVTISTNDTEMKEYVVDLNSGMTNGDGYTGINQVLDDEPDYASTNIHWMGLEIMDGQVLSTLGSRENPIFVFGGWELVNILPPPPASMRTTIAGVVTWDEVCGVTGYNVVVSPTDIDPSTATPVTVTGTTYTATGLVDGTTNYVYVQSVNANGVSEWISQSFTYYEGATCDYIVSGADIWDPSDPQPWGYYAEYSPNVEFWQNGVLVAQVRGDARAGVGISLISGQPVEIVWNAIYGYWDDPDKLLITNAAGDTLFYSEELFDLTPVTIGTFETTGCGLTEQSVGGEAVFWKAPEAATLSVAKGDLLPAIAGISVTHNFAQPVVSKSDGGAPTVTYNGVAYDNQTIAQADGDNGQNYIFSPTADGLLDICGKMGSGKKNFIFETATPVETLVTYTTKNAGEVTDKVAVDVVAVGKDANGDDMTIPKGVWDASAAINNTGGNAYVVMSFEVKAGKNYVVGVDGSKFMLVGYRYEPGGKFTAIPSLISADKTVKAVQYFDITGRAVKANAKGLIIEKTIYTDGTSSAKKVLRIDDSFKYSK